MCQLCRHVRVEPQGNKKFMKQNEDGTIDLDVSDLDATDVSEKNVERIARGYILGTEAMGRRRELQLELEEKVTSRIGRKGKWMTDKLFELIEGIYVIDKRGGKDGKSIRYYQVPPNLNAIIYAMDRVLGKPKQHIEKTEQKQGIILVEHMIKNLAGNPYDKRNEEKPSIEGAVEVVGELNQRSSEVVVQE